MKNIEKVCKNLNMDFAEASELFGDETLRGMQMAQICGGVDYCGMSYNCVGYLGNGWSVHTWVEGDSTHPESMLNIQLWHQDGISIWNGVLTDYYSTEASHGNWVNPNWSATTEISVWDTRYAGLWSQVLSNYGFA